MSCDYMDLIAPAAASYQIHHAHIEHYVYHSHLWCELDLSRLPFAPALPLSHLRCNFPHPFFCPWKDGHSKCDLRYVSRIVYGEGAIPIEISVATFDGVD